MVDNIQLEICAGSLSDVIAASSIPQVDRIELNCSLESGGLTPSFHTFLLAKKYSDKKIVCMVRPRQAGFIYNDYEKETMYADAKQFLEHGADGIVFGSLNEDFTIDEPFTKKMVDLIHQYNAEAIFHKAFDEVKDVDHAIKTLINLHVNRILTSGQKPNTEQGIQTIAYLIDTYGKQIEILPGGGVTKNNIQKIIKGTHAPQIHMTAKSTFIDQSEYFGVDSNKIQEIIDLLEHKDVKKHKTFTREDLEMFQNDTFESSRYDYDDDHDRM